MVRREEFMNKLLKLKDQHIIKVVTGVRRCGKSTLLAMFREELTASGVLPECCVAINFEDIRYEELKEYHKLYEYILEHLVPDKKNYIFLDEIQEVPQFQKAVDSLFLREDVDIYLTGSNAYMLSGELATLLSGRYVEVNMLPFSFKEYCELKGENIDSKTAFQLYIQKGGFPYSAILDDEWVRTEYLRGIYNTVLLKDIVARKRISDVPLLESIIKFLLDNVGNIVSAKKIADTLTSDGRKTTAATVDSYIQALKDAFILYEADRYDIKGRQFLKSLEKYYVADVGLRSLILGERTRDLGHILENLVYLELIRRGYQVYIGKVGNLEVDFIAEKSGEKIYYQVAATILDPATYEREFAPLKAIPDNYPKYVLTLDEFPMGEDGINQKNVIEFFMER